MPQNLLLYGVALLSTVVFAYVIKQLLFAKNIRSAKKEASRIVKEAERKSRKIVDRAQDEANKLTSNARRNIDREQNEKHKEYSRRENDLNNQQRDLEEKQEELDVQENELERKEIKIKSLREKQESLIGELQGHLEKVANMTTEEAQKILMDNVEIEMKDRAGKLIKNIEEDAIKTAKKKAKEIVLDAIQKTAVEHVTTTTTAFVEIENEEMKGRIIGKEGRNIRAFEYLTGVDVVIDDTPNGVILSAFDPIRREIAKMSMEKLVEDGRIHPSRIEEMIEQSKNELQDIIIERGERAADEVGLQFHPKIIENLGRLSFRTSYTQNILAHSLEAAHIAGIMASELGVNVSLAKRGALLHDIGKALDFEVEGSHDRIGADLCKKYGESDEIQNCIMAHHEEEPPETIEAVLVIIADAISSARPGARRESSDLYIKRLEQLEQISSSFDGVEKAYAIQAGREVRIVVKPEEVTDASMHKLAVDIAKRIENEVDYPGEVKVSLIRETRASGTAH